MSKAELSPTKLSNDPLWQRICQLLRTAEYELAAELLSAAQRESEQNGQAARAAILAAACRICLACRQCRAGAEWLWQAYQETSGREQELNQQLSAILELIGAEDIPEVQAQPAASVSASVGEASPSEREAVELAAPHRLWQRVQSLLGLRPGPQALESERKALDISGKTPVSAYTNETEIPIAPPPDDKVERSAAPSVEPTEAPDVVVVESEEEQTGRELPALVVYCLGLFRVYQNDQLIAEWSSLKGQSIFKYLITHKRGPLAKDILMDLFWPNVDPEDTRRNLHQAIYSLRQTLRQRQPELQPILFKRDCYLLNPEMVIWLDFVEFEKHVQAGQKLEGAGQLPAAMAEYSIAEALYQGDFLEEDLYEDWPSLQREHLRNLYLDIVDRLSKYYAQQRGFTASIALCQKILAKDNCYEEAYRRLMECYLAQGQRFLAVRQYHTCVQALKEELDLTPAEETIAVYRRIMTTL